jgi:3-deoxy-manno-octulosonate cytidylyltransferase (CMP-KDO synthetase)
MKLLDCTLRDGGYYTNWSFDDTFVSLLVHFLDKSGVDIIEMGYKSPLKGGKYRKCNDAFIKSIVGYCKSELAFMIDAKDFINGEVDVKLLKDIVKPSSESPFTYCRLAITPQQIKEALIMIDLLDELGYKVIVNVMRVSLLEDSEIRKFCKELSIDKVRALYFADSFGSLLPTRVKEIVDIFKETGKDIGIHTHDNLGLAFANSIEAHNNGVEFIDGTLTGMGRGVGNVRTEQLLMYYGYDYKYVTDFVTNVMTPMKNKYGWGWNHNYMLTGLKEIHPTYCQRLQSLPIEDSKVQEILNNIPIKDKTSFFETYTDINQKVSVIIPARYKSTRFPGKPLVNINGIPMIIRVSDIVGEAVGKGNVYIATENSQIAKEVRDNGYKVILTSDSCLTGTDRVAEASMEVDGDIIVNVQGDEPLLNPKHIQKVIDEKVKHPNHIINCMARIESYENVEDTKIPKMVVNEDNELMYSSRSAIPGSKYGPGKNPKKQVCIYAFSKDELSKFLERSKKGKTPLEWSEDIEINRFLEMGMKVKMVEVEDVTHAVDIPEDVKIVEELLNGN